MNRLNPLHLLAVDANRRNEDETIRIAIRRRREKNALHEAIDRRRRADAECEREGGYYGEPRSLEQHANGEANIPQHGASQVYDLAS